MKKIRVTIDKFFHRSLSRRAQSMTEFALAIPILLMLIFGIIEFGRIMQAWLALENGARFGVRYASTGSFNPDYCNEAAAALEHIYPGISSQDLSGGVYDCHVPDSVTNAEDKNAALQDWARLPSIRDASIAGSTGIAWDPDISGDYLQFLAQAYLGPSYTQTNRGVPGEEGFFNVTVCSNRVYPNGDRVVINTNPFYYSPYPPGKQEDFRFPQACETFNSDFSSALRFIDDAGGPGDRVRVILTYRHQLIMPLLNVWWPTLRLTSEREALVEKFRTSRVTGLTGGIVYAPTNTYTPTVTSTITTTPSSTPTPMPVYCSGAGSVLRQTWLAVTGSSINSLTSNYRYPAQPDKNDYPTTFEQAQTSPDVNNFGTRWRAYLCPPYTGEYVFRIASDDASELLLSGSENPAGATQIASLSSYTTFRKWDTSSSQTSGSITLQAGHLYYIEAKQKEGSGSDHISVAWTGPSDLADNIQIIDGMYLVPLAPEPTPTPEPASCDQLVVKKGQNDDQGEKLLIEKDSYVIQTYLQNQGPYPVYLLGAGMTYNGGWHNEVESAPAQTFDRYYFGSSSVYDAANTSAYPVVSTFTPFQMNAYTENYFKWSYSSPSKFGILPNVVAYPPVSPTAAVNPYPAPSGTTLNFFWSSDYTGTIGYKVVPPVGPTVVCTVQVTGNTGPSITPVFSENPIDSAFYIGANVSDANSSIDYVYFYVYNSSGTLVHWFKDTSNPYYFMDKVTNTLVPNVSSWWMGSASNPGPQVTNGNYTLSIMAQDKDPHKKANRIDTTFRILAPTPTPTQTASRTLVPSRTPTASITPSPTRSLTPSITPTFSKTPPPSQTPSKTPIPSATNTSQPSRTPTKTPTRTITPTPTQCLTPFEMGGCR